MIQFNIQQQKPTKSQPPVLVGLKDVLPAGTPEFWEKVTLGRPGMYRLGVDPESFVKFLEFNGFRKIVDDGEVQFVQIHNNILEERTITDIKDFTLEALEKAAGLTPREQIAVSDDFTLDMLFKFIYASGKTLFEVGKLDLIKKFEGEQYTPKKYSNAFFFRDAWVEITPSGCTVKEYANLPEGTAVWRRNVIDYDIKDAAPGPSQFEEFIRLVTGKDKRREKMLRGAMGYLMHPFFEGALRAVLLTDVGSSLHKANGRTGKGLIAQAMAQMLSTNIIPAKRWKSDDKFNFDTCEKDNKLVVLDDMPAGFHAESLYNVITEKIVVKKVFKQPFSLRAKILVNSNTMMRGDGSSTRGRFLEIEIDNFFSDKYKPIDHFGVNFFSHYDWSPDEWGRFYWYMMECSHINLLDAQKGKDCGVDYVVSQSIEQKRVLQNIEEEFFDFMEEKLEIWKKTPTPTQFTLLDLRTEYLAAIGDQFNKEKLSTTKFKTKILDYCDYKKYSLEMVSRAQNKPRYTITLQEKLIK